MKAALTSQKTRPLVLLVAVLLLIALWRFWSGPRDRPFTSSHAPDDIEEDGFPSDEGSPLIRIKSSGWRQHDPAKLRDPSERFLAYLSHSGLHNQRIGLVNAAVLAKMLNRTLIVPPLHLGIGVGWKARPILQRNLDRAEAANIAECRAMKHDERMGKCGYHWNTIKGSWSWLVDSRGFSNALSILDRPTFARSWYQYALSIPDEEIYEFPDQDRFSARIFDDPEAPTVLEKPGARGTATPFKSRVNLEEFERFDNFTLIEMGSMYGLTRLSLSLEENKEFYEKVERMTAFKQRILEIVSDAIVGRMGGKSNFVGVHLRIGGAEEDPAFKTGARGRNSQIFRTIGGHLGLSTSTIEKLLRENGGSPTPASTTLHSSHISCPHQLYDAGSPLAVLNIPLYVATDSKHPRTDSLTELFRNAFPCLVFLSDFRTRESSGNQYEQGLVPEVEFLMEQMTNEEGDRVGPFLLPLVEAEVVAKGKFVVGTPGSTFSQFAETTLYRSYHPAS